MCSRLSIDGNGLFIGYRINVMMIYICRFEHRRKSKNDCVNVNINEIVKRLIFLYLVQ
jgi:hypothetical protein